ncbi:MAG: alpha/beta fold hydrolase [Acidimicrobiia bacterium]|nr:alpha/beta fold hydrolase [Acidimicrobiia bacterium]
MDEAKCREVEGRLWASVGRAPTEHFVQLPRIDVKVRVQEVGDGPPALFLHGGPNSGSTWAPLVEHVEGFRCLLLDRPGTGLSEHVNVERGELTTFASKLVGDTLEALGIERAHVVASSLGGYCALWSASVEPERFDRMVQMACPALLPGQQLPKIMRAIMLPGVRKVIAVLPPNKKAGESIMRQIGHGASLDKGILPEAHTVW